MREAAGTDEGAGAVSGEPQKMRRSEGSCGGVGSCFKVKEILERRTSKNGTNVTRKRITNSG